MRCQAVKCECCGQTSTLSVESESERELTDCLHCGWYYHAAWRGAELDGIYGFRSLSQVNALRIINRLPTLSRLAAMLPD